MRPGLGDHDSAIMVDSLIKPLVNKSVSRKVYQFHKGNLKDLIYELSEFKPIRSGGGGALKAPPQFFALTHLILELHYCALGTFPRI